MQSWKTGEGYEDVAGFCKSASLEEIEKDGFKLTPGRYVGTDFSDADEIDFEQRFTLLAGNLKELRHQSMSLDDQIEKNLSKLVL